MKLFIPLGKRQVQSGRRRAEGSDAADKLCLVSVVYDKFLKIGIGRVYAGIAQGKENHVSALA